MLNWNNVLFHVKSLLGLPSGNFIEKTDDELKEWIINTSIPTFSMYYPREEYAVVQINDPRFKEPRQGEYRFFDPEDLSIYGISECYFPMNNSAFLGHPLTGPTDLSSLQCWALSIFKTKLFEKFTDYSISYTFNPPNIVKVLPVSAVTENFIIKFEAETSHDLRKIPGALKGQFLDLCLADCQILLGNIRSAYTSIQTPFGEIPIKGEEMLQRGEERRANLISLWSEDTVPGVIIEVY